MKRLSIAVILIMALFTSSLAFAQLALPDWTQHGHIVTVNPDSSTQAAERSSGDTSLGDIVIVKTLDK